MKRTIWRLLAIALALTFALGCALAEDAPEIDAEALYREGKEASDAGDYAVALEKLTPAAEAGYAPAQYYLGSMYQDASGVERDVERAIDLFTKSADQGYEPAMSAMALMYQIGEVVEQDYAKALEWWKRAALQATIDNDDPELARMLRVSVLEMYRQGLGTEPDMEAAQEWYEGVMKASPDYVDHDDPMGVLTNVEAVEMAQSRMNQVGYDCGREDGVADEQTGAMLTQFQRDKGLTVTGTLTRETALKLYDVAYRVTDSGRIQSAQSALNSLGYDCGTPDGIAGKKTEAALTQFQRDKGLTVSGMLTPETADALDALAGADDTQS